MQAWDLDEEKLLTHVKQAQTISWQKTPLGEVKPKLRNIEILVSKVCERFNQSNNAEYLGMLNSLLGSLLR